MTNNAIPHLYALAKSQFKLARDLFPLDLESDDLFISTDSYDDYEHAATILNALTDAIGAYQTDLAELLDDDAAASELALFADDPDAYAPDLYAALQSLRPAIYIPFD